MMDDRFQFVSLSTSVKYCYEDSGAPECTSYTTFIFIHGMGFNGGVFRPLFPIAAKRNYRVISLYRRGYAPSTPISDDEFAALQKGVDEQQAFIRRQGVEIAQFLLGFIRANVIPPINKAGEGGIVLIGWSFGTIHAHAVLANIDALPKEDVTELGRFLRAVVAHDANPVSLGLSNPPANDASFWFNPDIEERFRLFNLWVLGYFQHPDPLSKNLTHPELSLEFNTPTLEKPRTFQYKSGEEILQIISRYGFDIVDMAIAPFAQSVRNVLTQRAIFDKKLADNYLPRVPMIYICGREAPGVFLYGLWELEAVVDNPHSAYGPKAEKARVVKFHYLPQGNHFVFWDDPEWALDQYYQCSL
ncbi:Alpha/Beta hydrolase protein [Hygrophoropsis aurantiaca]|uniref:Alpha/Beta hydrolase protein n=1 Tax=Hygrophoropsis aurantiaca TaxID=72124 RepID=A0ACB8AIV3_9AGAM|nr:Alpha/Beta hydrolase protein [Hygrophoropsis aurantiaca]